jgi:hypothetical protein
MTISAISPFSASPISSFQTFRQTFGQLASALQSGDLTAAQNAYNTLSTSPIAQGNEPFAVALQQIGQDLQSGDLADAQKALASLQQQQQAHRGHHHHHGGGGISAPSSTSNTSNTSNSGGSSSSDPDGDGNTEGTTTILQISITVESDNKVDIKA